MPQMELTLVGCTGLPNTESLGKIDPYCTVQFEGKTWKTDECENTTEPQWNKTFKFNIADENSSQAHICVWNKNTVSDDFLGDFWLSVSGLVRGKPDDRKVLLTKCKGNAELHIVVTAMDFGAIDESPQTSYQQRPPMPGYAPPANYIQPPPVYNPPPPPANYNYNPPPPPANYNYNPPPTTLPHPPPPPQPQGYSGPPVPNESEKVKKPKKENKVVKDPSKKDPSKKDTSKKDTAKKDTSKKNKKNVQQINIHIHNKPASPTCSEASSTTYTDDTTTTETTDDSGCSCEESDCSCEESDCSCEESDCSCEESDCSCEESDCSCEHHE